MLKPESPGTGSLLPQEEDPPQETQVVLPAAFHLPYRSDETLDPITCSDGAQQVIGSLLYEGLFRLDETLSPQPLLCDSYTYDSDTFLYTFTLRSDARFSDGTPCTAADAATALRRAMASERYRSRLAQVTAVEGQGQTLTVTLRSGNTSFPALLDIPIVKSGTETSAVPLGTGPYQLSQDKKGRPILVKNPHARSTPTLPVEKILLSPSADRDAMLYQFKSRDVQLITADLTSAESVSITGGVQVLDADTTVLQYLGFNLNRPLFQNVSLRTALSLGINRDSLVNALLSGHGAPAQFPVSPCSPLYPQELDKPYSYDSFLQAMDKAGFHRGRNYHVTLLVNEENPFKVSVAEHLASWLSACDLKIRVQALPWEEYLSALSAGRFDLYLGEVKLPADWNLAALLSSSGALNYGHWADPETDRLLASYALSKRPQYAMNNLCAHLQVTAPIVPLCFKSTSVLVQDGVLSGAVPTAAEPFFPLSDCKIHLKED